MADDPFSHSYNTTNRTTGLSFSDGFQNDIFMMVHAISILIGIPTNVYVLWLISKEAGVLVASEFFAINLAVSEIAYNIVDIFSTVYHIIGTTVAILKPYAFFTGFVMTGRPLFQCCICAERYLAVIHPVLFMKCRPLRYKMACAALVWVVTVGFCLISMWTQFSRTFYIYSFVCCLVYFGVKVFCCLKVLRALKRPGPGEGDGEREGTNSAKLKAFKIILGILISVLINYTSVLVLFPLVVVFYEMDMSVAVSFCFATLAVNGLVQPFLFLHRAGNLSCNMLKTLCTYRR